VPKAPTRPPIQEAPSGPSRPLPERVIEYFKDVRAELRKVAWGTRTEVLNFFLLVTVGVIFIGVVVFAIDFGVNKLIEFLFSK
jgi:preprotein translocase subunit SecE